MSSILKQGLQATCLVLVSATCGSISWAQFVAPGLPSPELIRNADRFEPPRLADYAARLARQPDISGLWYAMAPAEAGASPNFDPEHIVFGKPQAPGESVFGPVAGTHLVGIPYTAEYQKMYDTYVAEALRGDVRDDFAACVPYGMPRMVGDSPVPFDIIQSPEVVFMYNDYGRTERRIYLDGRSHPTQPAITGEFGPTYSGHSVGHWEGNMLVVDTVGLVNLHFDETWAPHSDQLSMVERMRLIDTDILQIQFTYTDPVAFTKPWVVTRYYHRTTGGFGPAGVAAPGTYPRAYINLNDRPCVPNVEMDADGFQRTILPAEQEARNAAKAKAQAKSKAAAAKKPRH